MAPESEEPSEPNADELTVPYVPVSKHPVNPGYLIPAYLKDATWTALRDLEAEKGKSVDDYVAEHLGIPVEVLWGQKEGLPKNFGLNAAQIDAAALGLRAIERDSAFTNDAQMGVGKGRTAGAMMQYALQKGLIPIFVTAQKTLYTDMAGRDLPGVGNTTFNPLITDNNFEYTNGKGDEVEGTRSTDEAKELFKTIAETGKLPEGYHGIFTTYHQLQKDKAEGFQEKPAQKRARIRRGVPMPPGPIWAALRALGPKAIYILDESHLAAGNGGINNLRFRELLHQSGGTYFSSATWAKRPEHFLLYASANLMRRTGIRPDSLVDLINSGGNPLQQAITSMLVRSGELQRLELDWKGVKVEFPPALADAKKEEELADSYTSYIRDLQQLAEQVNTGATGIVDGVNGGRPEEAQVNLQSMNFGSRLFNLSNQYLLALRAESAVREALKHIQAGKKPFISLHNTMEGPMKELGQMNLPLSFNGLLLREMKKMLSVKVRDPLAPGDPSKGIRPGTRIIELRPEDLPDGGAFYRQLEHQINNADFGGMPISPIDYIKQGITKAEIPVKGADGKIVMRRPTIGEITARDGELDDSGNEIQLSKREKEGRNQVLGKYNNGDYDALIANGSSSTGISAHADPAFKDQRQRVMVIAQAAPDVNVMMQTMGRIKRFGSTSEPEYYFITSSLAGERRFMAMLRGKLASLNANTTARTESKLTQDPNFADDIFNVVGDRVVYRVMERHPVEAELAQIAMPDSQMEADDFARKATGRFVLLPNSDQAKLWNEINEEYQSDIRMLDQTGENPLKAKVEDFRAKTEASQVFTKGIGRTEFDGPAMVERVKVKPKGRPYQHADALAEADHNEDRIRQQFSAWRQKSFEAERDRLATATERQATPEQLDRIRQSFQQTRDAVATAMNLIGQTFGIDPARDASPTYYGVGIDLQMRDKEPADFTSPSRHQIVVATNTYQRKMKFPLSQAAISDQKGTMFVSGIDNPSERFKSSAEVSVTRHILTGNLLRGYEAARMATKAGTKPRVIVYTKDDGTTHLGILMPPDWNPNIVVKSITSADDLRAGIASGKPINESVDKYGLKIRTDTMGATFVRVNASSAGKELWGDPKWNDFFRGIPVQRGNEMVGHLDKQKLDQFWNFLNGKGIGVYYLTEKQAELETNPWSKFGPTEDAQNLAMIEKANERMAKNHQGPAANLRYVPPSELESSDVSAQAIGAIQNLFGKRLVFFDERQETGLQGFVDPTIPDTIFIKKETGAPLTFVIGHEMLHQLKLDSPEIYKELSLSVASMMRNTKEYQEDAKARGYDYRANVSEEMIADLVGSHFTDPKFWDKLAESKPNLFQRIATAVLDWIKRIGDRLNAYRFQVEEYFPDLAKAKTAVETAIAKYAELRSKGLGTEPGAAPGEEIKFSLNPIHTESEYEKMLASERAGLTEPEDARFQASVYGTANAAAVGHVAQDYAALPPEVQATIPYVGGRLAAIAAAEKDVSRLGGQPWQAPVGDLRTTAMAFSPDPWRRQKFIAVANNEMMNIVEEASEHAIATREAAKEAASILADEQRRVPEERLNDLANEIVNNRRGQLLNQRDAAIKAGDAVGEASANKELSVLSGTDPKTGRWNVGPAVSEVLSAILKAVPDTLIRNPLTPREDILRAWDAAKAKVKANAAPEIIASVEKTIEQMPDLAVRLDAIKHPEKSAAVLAAEAKAKNMAVGQAFLQKLIASPEFHSNYEQSLDLTGSRGLMAKENANRNLSWDNPLNPKESVTLRQDQTEEGYHHDVAALYRAKQWFEDYLDPTKNPNPDPLKVPAVIAQLDAIDNVHLNQAFNPKTGKPLVTGGGNIFAFASRLIGGAARIADYVLQMGGGPTGHDALMSVTNYSDMQQWSQNADNRLSVRASKLTAKAAKAHNLDPVAWGIQIGDEILRSHNAEGVPPLHRGNKANGHLITAADMDAVAAQKEYTDAQSAVAQRVMQTPAAHGKSVLIRDVVGKTPFERRAQPVGELTVPQRLAMNALTFKDEWNKIHDDKGLSKDQKADAWERMLDGEFLRQGLQSHVTSFKDPQYAAAADSPFRSFYIEMLKEQRDTGTMGVNSLSDLVDRLFDEMQVLPPDQQMSKPDIRGQILKEIDGAVRAFTADEDRTTHLIDPDASNVEFAQAENFLNRPRGRRLLPEGFYTLTTGTKPEQEQIRFQLSQVFAHRVIKAVEKYRNVLSEQRRRWKQAIDENRLTEAKIRESQVAGENFLNYSEVDAAEKAAEQFLENFKQYTIRNMGLEYRLYSPLNWMRNTAAGAALQRAPSMVNNYFGAPMNKAILDMVVLRGGKNLLLRFAPIGATVATTKAVAEHGAQTVNAIIGTILSQPELTPKMKALVAYMHATKPFWASFAGWAVDYAEHARARVQALKDQGALDPDPIRYNLDALTAFSKTGGRLTNDKSTVGRRIADIAKTAVLLGNETGLIGQAPRIFGVSGVEQMNNSFADWATNELTKSILLTSDRAFRTRQANGYDPQTSILSPQEIFGSKAATGADAANLRQYFERAGLNLDRLLIEYWQKKQANRAAEFLTPEQYGALMRETADFLNKGTFKNRPVYSSPIARWFGMFFGYGLNQNAQFARYFAQYSRDTRNPLWGHGLDMFATAASLYVMASVLGAIGQPLISWLKKFLYNEESALRPLLKARSLSEALLINTMNQAGQMPLIGRVLVNAIGAANPGSTMAMGGIQFFPATLANNLMQAFSKGWQTGDWARTGMEYYRNLIPTSRVVLNRIPEREGITNESALRNSLAANAPTGVDVKPSQYQTGSVAYSPARGAVDDVLNALSRTDGPDMAAVKAARQEGIQKLVDSGKTPDEAAKAFDRSILAHNPFTAVYGRNLTDKEMAELRQSLDPDQLANLDRIERGRIAYANAFGLNAPTFEHQEPGGGGGAPSGPGAAFAGAASTFAPGVTGLRRGLSTGGGGGTAGIRTGGTRIGGAGGGLGAGASISGGGLSGGGMGAPRGIRTGLPRVSGRLGRLRGRAGFRRLRTSGIRGTRKLGSLRGRTSKRVRLRRL